MGLFSKLVTSESIPDHKKAVSVLSPLNGKIQPLETFPCPVITERLLGEGVCIDPAGYQVFSPFDGIVEFYPKTSHQIRLKSKQGIKLMMHFGFEAEKLMGEGFRLNVQEGQAITQGQVLLEFDLPKLKKKLSNHLFVVTIINSPRFKGILAQKQQVLALQDTLMTLYI